jgi:hypothetical protein
MVDALRIRPADSEADLPSDIIEDGVDPRLDLCRRRVEAHRHVSAGNVEADAADRDVLLISDNAADWMRIAEMAVGAEHAGDSAADLHAALHLRDRLGVVLAVNLHAGHDGLPLG